MSRPCLLGLVLGLGVAATTTPAHADGEGVPIVAAYAVTGVGSFVTFIGTAASLSAHGTKPNGPVLLGWGIASTVSALIHTGFAISLLAIASQPCDFLCLGNAFAADAGFLSVGLAAANVAVTIPAFYLAGASKSPTVTLAPLTRGSSVSGLMVSGTF